MTASDVHPAYPTSPAVFAPHRAHPGAGGTRKARADRPAAPPPAPGALAPVAGFVCLPNAVLLAPGLSRDAKQLYAVLLHYARQDGACFPGRDLLQEALGCGHHQLSAYLRELEAAGLVARRRRGFGRTTLYTLSPLPVATAPMATAPVPRPSAPSAARGGPPRPAGDVAEAPPRASASTSRPARNRPPDRPETGPQTGPKPAADKDSGDQDAIDQQHQPPGTDGATLPKTEVSPAVVALLVQQGVTPGVARALASRHTPELIRRQLDCHRHRVALSGLTRNPAGALVRAIREDWAPPAAWTAAQTRAAARAEHEAEERRRREAEEARRREWEAKPLEERIAGRLQFWEAGRRRKGAAPTAAEIAARRAALLAELAARADSGPAEPVGCTG